MRGRRLLHAGTPHSVMGAIWSLEPLGWAGLLLSTHLSSAWWCRFGWPGALAILHAMHKARARARGGWTISSPTSNREEANPTRWALLVTPLLCRCLKEGMHVVSPASQQFTTEKRGMVFACACTMHHGIYIPHKSKIWKGFQSV